MSTRTGLRTHSCGELRASDVGSEVTLSGWVHRLRDHKGVLFADLRDRHGFTQVVFRPEDGGDLHQVGESLRPEDVVQIRGQVEKRPDGKINPKLPTGEVELRAKQVVILNRSETPPFEVRDSLSVSQELRLKHRYLDIRNPAVMERFEFRHRLAHDLRQRLHGEGFLEIETPFLTKSTPEGARDYLVPSRVAPGSFYALPQSPQLFKQILMVSGVDRYFQFVRCFRDEDLRADRQPEFTQVDLEMSFVEEDDVIGLVEVAVAGAVGSALGIEIPTPFQRILYSSAMEKYGSDCPDLRFGMEICDITDLAAESPFQVFRNVAESGGKIKGISAPKAAGSLSRREIDSLIPFATEAGAKGLAWAKVEKDGLTGPVAKHFPAEAGQALRERLGAEPGDLLLFVADEEAVAAQALGALRVEMA
ncbi:MAG: aspartate--tRNA ligase, partial [Planctomycetota bacterium]|nr:aspartate--tRNA ligase [Planctomycetota bacterium]